MTDRNIEQNGRTRVLKADLKGRVWSTAEQRKAALEEFERSGLSGARFAAVAGINYQTFAGWVRKARAQKRSGAPPAEVGVRRSSIPEGGFGWVEALPCLERTPGAKVPGLRVELRGGATLEITAPSQVGLAAALLRMMEGGSLPC